MVGRTGVGTGLACGKIQGGQKDGYDCWGTWLLNREESIKGQER